MALFLKIKYFTWENYISHIFRFLFKNFRFKNEYRLTKKIIILAATTNCVFFSTAKRQEPGDRNQAVKRQMFTLLNDPAFRFIQGSLLRAPRHPPGAIKRPRRRAQPHCFEIANGDRCKYNCFSFWNLKRPDLGEICQLI